MPASCAPCWIQARQPGLPVAMMVAPVSLQVGDFAVQQLARHFGLRDVVDARAAAAGVGLRPSPRASRRGSAGAVGAAAGGSSGRARDGRRRGRRRLRSGVRLAARGRSASATRSRRALWRQTARALSAVVRIVGNRSPYSFIVEPQPGGVDNDGVQFVQVGGEGVDQLARALQGRRRGSPCADAARRSSPPLSGATTSQPLACNTRTVAAFVPAEQHAHHAARRGCRPYSVSFRCAGLRSGRL